MIRRLVVPVFFVACGFVGGMVLGGVGGIVYLVCHWLGWWR